MSKLSRYNLLISLVRLELKCKLDLGTDASSRTHNSLLTSRSIEAWIFLAEDLMCENGIDIQGRDTRITNLISYINSHHISLTLKTLKDVYDCLINHVSEKSRLSNFIDFKGQFEDYDGNLNGVLLSPIKESLSRVIYSQTVVSRGCYSSIAKRDLWVCSQYLLFLSKINYDNVGLEEKALQDYYDSEAETKSFDLSQCENYIPAVQTILKNWMKDWYYDGHAPKHGPGSVADCKSHKLEKYFNLSTDNKLDYLYQYETQSFMPFWHKQSFDRTSKLVFVPKNFTKLRSISMEPATLQYFQQGCMNSLYKYFRTNRKLNTILKLEDQHQNKSFAYTGSITNDYATIDLSHASDSVNWSLVKKVFAKCPRVLKWLLCTRSSHTQLPDGCIIELSKYAPMGSALCFPVESLIFAAIAKLSILLCHEQGDDRDMCTGIRSSIRSFTVYGDDIILPQYAANKCIELLLKFGFTPNEEKSYLDGPFKESCGGNYFCGYDITALKYAPKFNESYPMGVAPEAYAALCSYANLAYEKGLYALRLYCIKLIFEAGLLPYFTDRLDTAPAIYSPQPTNFHLKKIYRRRYQKYQYIYTGTKVVAERSDDNTLVDEDIYLFDQLLALSNRDDEDHLPQLNGSSKRVACDNNGIIPIITTVIKTDIRSGYNRDSLLPNVYKYTSSYVDC